MYYYHLAQLTFYLAIDVNLVINEHHKSINGLISAGSVGKWTLW